MTDEMTTDLREEVRARYAKAARAVLEPRPGVTAACCESSPADSCWGGSAAESCCGAGPSAAEAVGGVRDNLYRAAEAQCLPEEAVLASLGSAKPIPGDR